MLIVLWLILRILFFAAAAFLIYYYFKNLNHDGAFDTFKNGIKTAFKDCGFNVKTKDSGYSIELYKWTINENDEVCEEALDRATWPAMDIADWMKEGLPRSADGTSLCGRNCRCKLNRYKVRRSRQPKSF
ncbi:MAG: hypothetical protein AB7S78_05310 [Candidatus Omnitrophota bacterium]